MIRDEQKKAGKKRLYMSLFIIVIMSFSVLGFIIGGGSERYNGFKFKEFKSGWIVKINKQPIFFDNFPTDVLDIEMSSNIANRLKSSFQIDVTSDFNSTFKEAVANAEFQLSQALAHDSKFIRVGFRQETEFNALVLDCSNATQFVPVMYFKEANETSIKMQGDCIILSAKNAIDVIAIKDLIMYTIFGII